MSKKLIRKLLLGITSLTVFSADAVVISVHTDIHGKSSHVFSEDSVSGYQFSSSQVERIAEVSGNLNYEVDFEAAAAAGVEVTFLEGLESGTNYVYLPFEKSEPTGPFYDSLISTVNLTEYEDIGRSGALVSNGNYSKEPGAGDLLEFIDLGFQITGYSFSEDSEFMYLNSFLYSVSSTIIMPPRGSIDEFELTSLEEILESLFKYQGNTFEYYETLSTSRSIYDINSNDFLYGSGRGTTYHGTASYTISADVAEPGAAFLLFLALAGLAVHRRRSV